MENLFEMLGNALMPQQSEGVCAGELCNRNGCKGVIAKHEKEGSCSCHINPPCGYCTTQTEYCPECDWSAQEDEAEYNRQLLEVYDKNKTYYEKQMKEFDEARELFNKKYRGEIPADKLEIRSESHTHFSMIKKGVFPKDSETQQSIREKVDGTFGGRFTKFDSYRFEFIAYTD